MGKRKLGLGKVQSKKQKVESENKDSKKNEELLTVELANEVNPDDPLSQLFGLWQTWKESERNNELILNGIINECDRILRNCKDNGGDEEIQVNDKFYGIYSLALCDLSKFKPEEEVKEWINSSLDRLEEGFSKFGDDNVRLKLIKCNIILDKIAILYIGQMNTDSKKSEFPGLSELFNEFFELWEDAIKRCESKANYEIFNEEWVLEILNIFDDLLDIIDKFGNNMSEVVDSDEEDEEDDGKGERAGAGAGAGAGEEEQELGGETTTSDALKVEDFQLAQDHPLYEIQKEDKYNIFWRDNMLKYKEILADDASPKIKRSVYEKLGQSYLMEAEEPIAFFNSYQYEREEDEEEEDEEEDAEMKAAAEDARREGQRLVGEAIGLLRETQDEEDPKTWVNLAEALITEGNLFDLDSPEQEKAYAEAEKLLRRANNATHGHYEDILQSLVGEE